MGLLPELLIPACLSLLVAALLACLLSRRTARHGLDHPREQSLHQGSVSRLGGVAILSGLVVGMACLSWGTGQIVPPAPMCAGLAAIALVSLWDDLNDVAVWIRLAGQLVGAALLVWPLSMSSCLEITPWLGCWPTWLGIVVLTMGIVWMTNLYNFMDGTDGLAAGMAVIGFAALACLGFAADDALFMGACLVVAAAVLGFLLWNLPPASIFMGDSGSTSLGFLVAGFTLWGAGQGLFPLEAGALIFAPFVVDATITLARRLYRRERIWQPHRTHYYQRLILAGCSVQQVLMGYYVLMLASAGSALLFIALDEQARGLLLIALLVQYTLLLIWAEVWLLKHREMTR